MGRFRGRFRVRDSAWVRFRVSNRVRDRVWIKIKDRGRVKDGIWLKLATGFGLVLGTGSLFGFGMF